MNILNRKFIAELQAQNQKDRIQRHPQFEEIHGLMGRLSALYNEVEVETARRVRCGIAVKASY